MRVVIVGGVAGGMSAATRLRRLSEETEIVVLERSGYVSYANCGLPYYVGGVIDDEADLLLQTPDSLHQRFHLDVRVNSEVVALDTPSRTVRVRRVGDESEYSLTYDVLILSPGATPVIPPLPGIERAMPLRTVEDVERMVERLSDQPASVAVIGGGFIGLEIAENLAHRGLRVTVIEALDQVLAPLDPEMAGAVVDEMERHGVGVRLGSSVVGVGPSSVSLASGDEVPGEMVVVAIGVRPDVTLARTAGLEIGPRGGIWVNEVNQTSDPAIYALGDAAEKRDALDGSSSLVPLANVANRHGRVVADHIMGREIRQTPTIGTAIVKVFDLTIAATGWNEKRLRAAGRPFSTVHSHPSHHAGYYPGAESMMLKLLFDPTSGQILGAQGVGYQGVDKRIDVLATALYAHLRAPELADLELAYAPPFGSAKDPVNMLGYMAENVLEGPCRPIQWYEVAEWLEAGAVLVDVRTPAEFADGAIPGALNIPLDDLRQRADELKGRRVVVTCRVGQRGHTGTMLLLDRGIDAVNLDGGYLTWRTSPVGRSLHPVS